MQTVLMIEVISSQLLPVIAIDAGRALRCSARGAATRACRRCAGFEDWGAQPRLRREPKVGSNVRALGPLNGRTNRLWGSFNFN